MNKEIDDKAKSIQKEQFKLKTAVAAFTRTYLDMAEDFHEIQPYFYDRNKIWWLWDFENKCWNITDEIDILNSLKDNSSIQNITKNGIMGEIKNSLMLIGRKKKPKEAPKTWIQFKEKIIDISTGEEFEASPDYFITNPIPWKLGSSEETPTMDKIFSEWVGDKYKTTLYEIISYCIICDYPIHRLFCLNGTGLNGKSKYLELIQRFIGDKNKTATELDTLLSNRFESAKLYKKLVCIMGETNFGVITKTSLLKKLTGQDLIGYEFKNKNPFDDYNYAKILISTNTIPTTSDKSEGYYRRWLIIDFPNKFDEKKDILAEIPEQEYNNLARKSISVLKKLMDKREFDGEGSIEERMKRYEEKSNPLLKFINKHCIIDIDGFIQSTEFINTVNNYMRSINQRPLDWQREILPMLLEMGIERRTFGNQRGIVGIRWKNTEEVKVEEVLTPLTPLTPISTQFPICKIDPKQVYQVYQVYEKPSLPVENDQNVSLETYNSLQNLVNIVILKYINEEIMTPAGDFVNPKEGDMLNLPLNIALKLIKSGQAQAHMFKVPLLDAIEATKALWKGDEVPIENVLEVFGWEDHDINKAISEGYMIEVRPGFVRVI